MSKLSYSEKLRDPRWQRKRLEVLNAHNFVCEDCGRRDQPLEIHHCYYIRGLDPWKYSGDLLMCLCDVCHEFRQGREEAMHVSLGQVLRQISIDRLENVAWDMIHDAIREAGLGIKTEVSGHA